MNKLGYLSLTLTLVLAAFVGGASWTSRPTTVSSASGAAQALHYSCPMHPQYTSDHPGDCPICGMRLVPVDARVADAEAGTLSPDTDGLLRVSADQQQLLGVRLDSVERASVRHVLRVTGRIAVDDDRLYRIVAASEGWTRTLGANPAGTFVKNGQLLATYYAPNLQANQQALLFNLLNTDQYQLPRQPTRPDAAVASQAPPVALNLQIAIDALRGLGMSDRQIDEIQHTHRFATEINIYSPVSGFVIARTLSPEQRFDKGAEMYRIADIGHVWVMTDIFEKDSQFMQPRAEASVLYQDRQFRARMTDALPQFDEQSRTLKARFELENPGFVLRPDMFVDVEIPVELPPAITLPADAVFDSGLRKTVFVDHGNGYFEPRRVETGWRVEGRVQVVRGLMEGERVAGSSNFLLDSESRMKAAAAGVLSDAAKDPICGMEVDGKRAAAAGRSVTYDGDTYYFCSERCKHDFEKDPRRYVVTGSQPPPQKSGSMSNEMPMQAVAMQASTSAAMAKDPVCGMNVDPTNASDAGLKLEHAGKTYFFCSKDCKEKFAANPGRYLTTNGGGE
jgi:membrane fusion protein, copper/silver efflux system